MCVPSLPPIVERLQNYNKKYMGRVCLYNGKVSAPRTISVHHFSRTDARVVRPITTIIIFLLTNAHRSVGIAVAVTAATNRIFRMDLFHI